MKQEILFIINSVAGRGISNKDIDKIISNLESSGYTVCVEYTTQGKSAEDIVKQTTSNATIYLVAGGDGTLNEVVNGITKINKKANVAFIPSGTTNDFSRTLNIPQDKFIISQNLDNTKVVKVDTGKLNEKYFNYVSAFGVFTKTSYYTDRKMKNLFGRAAYIATGTKDFLHEDDCYKMKIKTDTETIDGEFAYGSISNSKFLGGFKMFKDEEVKLDDGKFELLLIKKEKNKGELLKTYTKLINHIRDDNVIFLKTSNLEIEADRPINWSLDGELERTDTKIQISNLQKNMNFITM